MRILRVAQNLYPEVVGGGTYHVHALSRDQAAMGHEVLVLTVTADETLPRREERDGYTVVRRSPTVELLGNEISIGVGNFIRGAADFDVIHAHSHLYFSTNLAALKRRVGSTPLAITNHGLYSQTASKRVFDLYLRTLGRWSFNRADVLLCYTSEDRERIRSFGVDSRVEVVHNGVDTRRFTPRGPASERIDHEGTVVLFVGRLVDGKRPGDAVKAVSRLPDRLDAKLYIVGDGPRRSELEAVAGDDVAVLGQLPYDEMPSVYRGADVLVLPSRAEGVPRTLLEALATARPVVTSDLPQLRSLVDGTGIAVPVGKPDRLAGALRTLIDAPELRRRLGDRGRQRVSDDYEWSDTVELTTSCLSRLPRA